MLLPLLQGSKSLSFHSTGCITYQVPNILARTQRGGREDGKLPLDDSIARTYLGLSEAPSDAERSTRTNSSSAVL